MIDSHAHLYWDSFQEDFEGILDRALEVGITHIINIGVDLETSQKAIKQAGEITKLKVYSTAGYHPNDAVDSLPHLDDVSIHNIMGDLEKLCKDFPEKIVAIGECGLDFFSSPPSPSSHSELVSESQTLKQVQDDKQLQRHLLTAQVTLAKRLGLPLVIHCRDAWDEIFNYLDNTKGVFHCWSGNLEDAQKALELGYYISFAGNITYPKAENLRAVAKEVPLDRILIETDSPFLSPQGKRGERNEPANVLEVAKTIAEAKGVTLEEVMTQTADNAKKMFNIED